MKIGVPKEIKNNEFRVGMIPAAVRELTSRGHSVFVETKAGDAIDLSDEIYARAGATILKSANEVFAQADMIVKVKEPQGSEIKLLRPGQTLFTYLHLAPDPEQTKGLIDAGILAIAYETVTDARGGLPLLAPMSEVAGRMSIQAGARCLEMEAGGRGQLLGGVPGVPAAKVVILGGGVVGTNAARMAMGLEAHVTVIDVSLPRLYELDLQFGAMLNTIYSTIDTIEEHVLSADLVVGAVLLPGAAAPKLITEAMVKGMKKGLRARRCRHRPGRLFGNLAPDHACEPDLQTARRGALLRRQHAGRGGAHLDLRAQQRDAAFRDCAGRERSGKGDGAEPASARRAQRLQGRADL